MNVERLTSFKYVYYSPVVEILKNKIVGILDFDGLPIDFITTAKWLPSRLKHNISIRDHPLRLSLPAKKPSRSTLKSFWLILFFEWTKIKESPDYPFPSHLPLLSFSILFWFNVGLTAIST